MGKKINKSSCRSFHTKSIWSEYEYLSNDNKANDIHVDHGLKMNLSRREIRVLLLQEFRLGHKVMEAVNNICSTVGEGVLSIRTAQHWFNHFKSGSFELDDLPRSGRPLKLDVDLLRQLIEDPRLTLRWLAEQLGCSYMVVEKHLNKLGKMWRGGVWILHELSPH